MRVHRAGGKFGIGYDPAQKSEVGRDAEHHGFIEGSSEPVAGGRAVLAPGHDLGDQRVVDTG